MGQAGTANSDIALAERIQTIASAIPGTSFHEMEKMGGSEDFTEMMCRVQKRGGLATNIGIGADFHGVHHRDKQRECVLPAHTSVYDFDERALSFATQLLVSAALELMHFPEIS